MGTDATSILINEYAARPELLRQAVAQHQTWIEQQLGVSLSDVIILDSDLDLSQIGVELLLAIPPARRSTTSIAKRLRPFVLSATIPPEFPPFCEFSRIPRTDNLFAFLGGKPTQQKLNLSWEDCPIALHLKRGQNEFVAISLNVAYHSGPKSDLEGTAHMLIARRENSSISFAC